LEQELGFKLFHRVGRRLSAGDDFFAQRKRAVETRFRVQVDGQTKSSHATKALAAAAALQIKNSYPVVQVSVHDAEEGQTTLVERSSPD
jgi:hypothetical protein